MNLKYGLGLELNNYRYKSTISYRENGVEPYSNGSVVRTDPFIFRLRFHSRRINWQPIISPFLYTGLLHILPIITGA